MPDWTPSFWPPPTSRHRSLLTGLFVKNGSGLQKPSDLVGKRVGVPSLYTLLHVLARRWLKENGIDYDKVDFAEVGFQQMANSLDAGIVDAVDAIDTYYDRVAQIGYVIGNPDATVPKGTLTSVYAATRAWSRGRIKQPSRRSDNRSPRRSSSSRKTRRAHAPVSANTRRCRTRWSQRRRCPISKSPCVPSKCGSSSMSRAIRGSSNRNPTRPR